MPKKTSDIPELPKDLKDQVEEIDAEEPKAVLKLVLDAFERGVKLGRELNESPTPPKKKSFWD